MSLESDDEKEFNAWLKRAAASNIKHIEESTVFVSIASKNYLKDPLCALQLGLAILMDKPIILVVDKNEVIPVGLTRVAKLIERVDLTSKQEMKRVTESIELFARSIT